MHERGAVQKLDGRCSARRGYGLIVVAAGMRDRETELRPDAMASWEDRVVQRRSQKRRRAWARRSRDDALQSFLDAGAGFHRNSHFCTFYWSS